MPDIIDGSAHLDGLAQDAPDAPREQTRAAASLSLTREQVREALIEAGGYLGSEPSDDSWIEAPLGDLLDAIFGDDGAPSLPD